MTIAQGRNKSIRYKKQSALGTIATSTNGQIIRRSEGGFTLNKETYNTADEITSTQQMNSSRHGVKSVSGSINNILSAGTYADFLGSLVRRDFTSVTAITGMSITIAASGSDYTLTRASGSFLTGGIKVGMVVRLTAGSFNAANLNKNLLVLGVTATVLTVTVLNNSTLTAEGPIASAAVSVSGKVSYVPSSGHTQDYYTFEEFYSDLTISERNQDVKIGSASLTLPGSGNTTIDFSMLGLNQTRATSAYFSSPTAETTTDALIAASGKLIVDGTAVANVTDLTINIDGNQTEADGVVGSDLRPDIFDGKVMVTGSFTAYFENSDIADAFLNEEEISLLSALADGTEANAEYQTYYMPRIKLNTDTTDDGEVGLKRTYEYEALYNAAGGATLATQQTTIQICDSQA